MPLKIELKTLLSRITRKSISEKGDGIRIISPNGLLKKGSGGSWIDGIFNFVGSIVGFISDVLPRMALSAVDIFSWIISGVSEIVTFDWNASDTELAEMQKSHESQLYGAWGGLLGTIGGYFTILAIGSGIGMVVPVIGGVALSKLIQMSIAQNLSDEVFYAFKNAIRVTIEVTARNMLISGYSSIRRAIKDKNGILYKSLPGDVRSALDKWGANDGAVWTISDQFEQKIQSLGNPNLIAFTNAFADQYFDTFIEGGFIIAQTIDEAYAANKQALEDSLGKNRTIEIYPNEQSNHEIVIYQNIPEKLIIPAVQQTINTHRLVHNRDVGLIVGEPHEQWIRTGFHHRILTITWRELPEPPYKMPNGKTARQSTVTIYDSKRGLTWEVIKAAANRYNWGKFKAQAIPYNGIPFGVYGATKAEAKQKILELAPLCTDKIVRIDIKEEEMTHPDIAKRPTMMYPAYATLLIKYPIQDINGRTDLSGQKYDEEKLYMDLWLPVEPPGTPTF